MKTLNTLSSPLNSGWSYSHRFGCMSLADDVPFLVVTENAFWNGRGHGYTWYELGVQFSSEEEGKKVASELNTEFGFLDIGKDGDKKYFNSENSQVFLLALQDERFYKAKIRKEVLIRVTNPKLLVH